MFNRVHFEISGICNARCYWCQTGYKNRDKTATGKFVNFNEFKKAIYYLRDENFIGENSIIALYSWGEPFIYPRFKEIIRFLNSENIKFELSTNASKLILFEENNILRNLQYITISMPGFSQDSYDKIHGFKFDVIKENITKIVKNFRDMGFGGQFLIAYHIYQFNMDEIPEAMKFAAENGISIVPSFAYINDFERFKKYLKSELSNTELKKAGEQLFLYYYNDTLKNMPLDYICPQYDILSLDENCNAITCCGDSTSIGKIFDLKPQQINPIRMKSDVCIECNKIGQSYLANNVPIPKHILMLK